MATYVGTALSRACSRATRKFVGVWEDPGVLVAIWTFATGHASSAPKPYTEGPATKITTVTCTMATMVAPVVSLW